MSDRTRLAKRPQTANSDSFSALEAAALDEEVIADSSPSEKAKLAETLKNVADARSVRETLQIKRSQFRTTAIAAWLAVLALIGIVAAAISQEQKQSEKLAVLQRDASEEAQWREALKLVSFQDAASSQTGFFAMQGFFGSPQYAAQARTIAGLLLPEISNVYAFDQAMSTLGPPHTDRSNYKDLTNIAQMLGFDQRARYHITGAASKKNTPFLLEAVGAMKARLGDSERDKDMQARVAAWELETTSRTLRNVWTDKDPERRLSPNGWLLSGAVLENASFDGLDFSEADFSFGILFNSSFKGARFMGATLKDTYLRKVAFDGADFSGVRAFTGSRWEDSNWWDAKCVPQPMLDYLLKADPHPLAPEAKSKLASNCR